jgi:molybdenum cofactor biosynthesis protein B
LSSDRPHVEHLAKGPRKITVRLVTVSSSRYEKAQKGEKFGDETADEATREIARLGYELKGRELISDDEEMLSREAKKFLAGPEDVLVFTGGTGVAPRDVTIEAIRPFMEKELEGFGEILRSLSYKEIGEAAMLTRATAGVAKGKLIVCLPGSPAAVRLALQSLGKEIPHVLFVARS